MSVCVRALKGKRFELLTPPIFFSIRRAFGVLVAVISLEMWNFITIFDVNETRHRWCRDDRVFAYTVLTPAVVLIGL